MKRILNIQNENKIKREMKHTGKLEMCTGPVIKSLNFVCVFVKQYIKILYQTGLILPR
jgi:hypothetical protein